MTYRFIPISLSIAFFCTLFAHFADAEVVQAYRKPSEADIQWLFSDALTPIPNATSPAVIIQAEYTPPLTPHPCKPAQLPNPPIPPAPQAMNRRDTGLIAEEGGVAAIAPVVVDAATPVVQMSGDRLPPPSKVPTESPLPVPVANPAAETMPLPESREPASDVPWHPFGDCGNVPGACDACLSYDDYTHKYFYVPDMIGSSAWLTGYSSGFNTTRFTLPTMLLTRPNVAEHFNADVQTRIWADYRHWSNAMSINDGTTITNRAVEQFSFGLEKQILRRSSVELRVPVIYQFGSGQPLGKTATELGNVSVFAKQVLRQGSRWTITGGIGTTLPTAEDWRPAVDARLKNKAYYFVSFLGVQWHPNNKSFGHIIMQADMPIEKNALSFGGNSVKVDGQQMMRTGIQLGRWLYRDDQGKKPCRLGVFAEVDYAVVTDGSADRAVLSGSDMIYVSAFNSQRSTLTAAAGMPMVFGKLTCANSIILPISGSNRPFSVGYNFSLSRQF